MNTIKQLFVAVALAAMGCGSAGDEFGYDKTDFSDDPEDLSNISGELEQAISVEVSALGSPHIMGAPQDEFVLSSHRGFRVCTDGPAGSTSCRNKTLTVPQSTNFSIVVETAELQSRFTEACGSLHASVNGWSCSASVGANCNGMVCVVDEFTPGGLSGFDLRNYIDAKCNATSETRTATWNSNTYTVQRCTDYRVKMDLTAIKAFGTSSAQDLVIARMVANNIVLQVAGQGGTANTANTGAYRWPYTSVPASPPTLLNAGQTCRLGKYNPQTGSLNFSNGGNCANQ